MINHIRTLLLNKDGESRPPIGYLGEEYTPPSYFAAKLDKPANSIRNILFGSDPDDYTLNYRLAQYMGLLHHPDVVGYTLQADSRFTYQHDRVVGLPVGHSFGPTAGLAVVEIRGKYLGDDSKGHNMLSCDITIRPGTGVVEVSKGDHTLEEFTAPSYPTNWRPFPEAPGLEYRVVSGDAEDTAQWSVAGIARPSRSLFEISERLASVTDSIMQIGNTGYPDTGTSKALVDMYRNSIGTLPTLASVLLLLANYTEYLQETT